MNDPGIFVRCAVNMFCAWLLQGSQDIPLVKYAKEKLKAMRKRSQAIIDLAAEFCQVRGRCNEAGQGALAGLLVHLLQSRNHLFGLFKHVNHSHRTWLATRVPMPQFVRDPALAPEAVAAAIGATAPIGHHPRRFDFRQRSRSPYRHSSPPGWTPWQGPHPRTWSEDGSWSSPRSSSPESTATHASRRTSSNEEQAVSWLPWLEREIYPNRAACEVAGAAAKLRSAQQGQVVPMSQGRLQSQCSHLNDPNMQQRTAAGDSVKRQVHGQQGGQHYSGDPQHKIQFLHAPNANQQYHQKQHRAQQPPPPQLPQDQQFRAGEQAQHNKRPAQQTQPQREHSSKLQHHKEQVSILQRKQSQVQSAHPQVPAGPAADVQQQQPTLHKMAGGPQAAVLQKSASNQKLHFNFRQRSLR